MIGVVVTSGVPQYKVPTIVNLKMDYYQIDNNKKQLIDSSIAFEGFIDPKDENLPPDYTFRYNLTIEYSALSHTS